MSERKIFEMMEFWLVAVLFFMFGIVFSFVFSHGILWLLDR